MTMDHDEIATLLGAYALDAVEADEVRVVEEHLETCPRCRAELASHREVAARLGNSSNEAPPGVWDRIADQLHAPQEIADPAGLIANLPRPRSRTRFLWPALAAAAIVAVIALGLQVNSLNHRVDSLQSPSGSASLTGVISAALAARHSTISLTSTSGKGGTVILTPDGSAYWLSSDLPQLPPSETYQVWGLVRGRAVSLVLLGADASRYAAFRVQSGTRQVMVTVEPEGGTPAPTTPVVLSGSVPHLA